VQLRRRGGAARVTMPERYDASSVTSTAGCSSSSTTCPCMRGWTGCAPRPDICGPRCRALSGADRTGADRTWQRDGHWDGRRGSRRLPGHRVQRRPAATGRAGAAGVL